MLAHALTGSAGSGTEAPSATATAASRPSQPVPTRSSERATALTVLDGMVRDAERGGFVSVTGRGADLAAVGAHLARRARAVGRRVLHVGSTCCCDEPWRELASLFDVQPNDAPPVVAATIRAALAGAVVIVEDQAPSRWGAAVAAELARCVDTDEQNERAHEASSVLVLSEAPSAPEDTTPWITLDDTLTADEVGLWWSAVAADRPELTSTPAALAALLEGAATMAPRSSRPSLGPAGLSDEASRLLHAIGLGRRSCTPELLTLLGSAAAGEELLAAGLIVVGEHGRVEARVDLQASARDTDRLCAATALCADDTADPWAWMRAAELFAEAAEPMRAERAALQALGRVVDRTARNDLYGRIDDLAAVVGSLSYATLLRLAEMALDRGDLDRARSFASDAARGGEQPEVLLILGRASTARGDFEAAHVALCRAAELAPTRVLRARIAVQHAEHYCAAGDREAASRFANYALEQAGDADTSLAARNVLGKLLLSEGRWQEAEVHFASDAAVASCSGSLEAELRARLNRAIAVLQAGRLNEARTLLEALLDDTRRFGQPRGEAMVLTNLASVATVAHEYTAALSLFEQAISAMQGIGDQLRRATLTMNLAELRLRLGLVSEAEQALRFARSACGSSVPQSHVASLCYLAALIHLARRQTQLAATDIEEAIVASVASHNGAKLGECHRLAVRIALEDGDLERAGRAIESARECASSPTAAADLALLEALLRRASGEAFADAAVAALTAAHQVEDIERQREAHLLLHHAARHDNHAAVASEHLRRAVELRDRMAASLDEPLRKRFLARPDLRELAKLEARQRQEHAALSANAPAVVGSYPVAPISRAGVHRAAASRRMVGASRLMRELAGMILKVGRTDTTVLIHGESGTGKELVAEALHGASDRASGPLVKVNCAALVETLLLSELFGHEKGAFTGASNRRRGRFEQAHGGTLFLDEIGDISPRTQVALLRVLQEKTFERVGGTSSVRADVRIICATHRNLEEMVRCGKFREDLYYRLCGVTLSVPPLRDRLDDLPLLCEALLERFCSEQGRPIQHVTSDAVAALSAHGWPGNIRELDNSLRAAALFADSDAVDVGDFRRHVPGLEQLAESPPAESQLRPRRVERPNLDASEVVYAQVRNGSSLPELKRELERACIARALSEAGGNITRAATMLGMKRPRLSQLVRQFGLKANGVRS